MRSPYDDIHIMQLDDLFLCDTMVLNIYIYIYFPFDEIYAETSCV